MIDFRESYTKKSAALKTEFGVKSVMALPKITKVTIGSGIGKYRTNKDMVAYIDSALGIISGQKPMSTQSRKSIAGFKVREGEVVGYKVTLRGQKMTDFLNRLINVTLPRIRDFKGIDQLNFDQQGSLTIGFRDQQPFAELGHEAIDKPFGVGITITITNSTAEKSFKLLKELGFPMKLS
ncbi:50S ribosomal protein L5 [Candidatus Berkelbacteria bacterium RIFCSPLOWO2_01_FULL_50_28]|uniref:Large ribosomal subunit protein uL5 n=1 Tax=Candidatus Berkelbacteria bacterium RIFCSPLOWO2_01_FULL_50_28 TaxID=1797471 RepID=A0A1F5EBZ4_9BACT|nr:MAG: 50S ribosomal protein L5 [Candidatus Berkelbacteria bacterium RIFCSPHIGHO2_01_FULL_50_36]OGD62262.1 MAG: 50S ribosomal protein L5 [Candidatus Berkelbacteria bacterium RIFCSPHIGHO2_12_FULL_50_11]OGD64905.1 MAG: 50S ribosomal protein L5 [Candidatus Berkelbacteria bacterium RIFCSPLOWO2_01_FULL_50_28]